ncbi:uncharacterized protein LOC141631743 [Silene latifolia]|uniref:uncharacterized protein LOC141631743 n=1 Tax=Silene latifolia TaxID=37657 RepID=UPI003D777E90
MTRDVPVLNKPIIFSDDDIPPFGANHNLALYITVKCMKKSIPMVLVNDGSEVNVIPLKTAHKLGIKEANLVPTNQGVCAYDGTRCKDAGVITLTIATKPFERQASFQVVDIDASFNMLLGRPWIHAAKAVTSTLHQKIRAPFNGKTDTIPASPNQSCHEKVGSLSSH